ncbi:MAG TPA: Hsp33 family molecular chaperone HslO [Pseudomonadales bacterium]
MNQPHDIIHRFSFRHGPVRGQWVRLRDVLEVLNGHQHYPENVASLLGEMLAAVALVADGIKFKGSVALQSRGPGPLTTVLAECRGRHLLRGIARWPDAAELPESDSLAALIGRGQLALTLVPDDADQPYQGLVGITERHLAGNLERYFLDSEQLPTRLLFAGDGASVTGLLLQRLPDADHATEIELDQNHAFWEEIGLLTSTLSDEELASLDPQTLLRRLYAEHSLTLQPPRSLRFSCTCSREKTRATLKAFSREELLELIEEDVPPKQPGEILVTCEICGAVERFDAFDIHLLFASEEPQVH